MERVTVTVPAPTRSRATARALKPIRRALTDCRVQQEQDLLSGWTEGVGGKELLLRLCVIVSRWVHAAAMELEAARAI